jgi:hypothetical protein
MVNQWSGFMETPTSEASIIHGKNHGMPAKPRMAAEKSQRDGFLPGN